MNKKKLIKGLIKSLSWCFGIATVFTVLGFMIYFFVKIVLHGGVILYEPNIVISTIELVVIILGTIYFIYFVIKYSKGEYE